MSSVTDLTSNATVPALLPFLDRLCRLVRRLEGCTRAAVSEALRRQDRQVRDAARLRGLARVPLDGCCFEAPPGSDRSGEVRDQLFRAAGAEWPPADPRRPYRVAAEALGMDPSTVDRLLYADCRDRRILVRAPKWDGPTLLARYDFELARAVLLKAESLELRARGGWKATFRAIKLARLMAEVEREGRRTWRVRVTGPASPYLRKGRRSSGGAEPQTPLRLGLGSRPGQGAPEEDRTGAEGLDPGEGGRPPGPARRPSLPP